MKQLTRLFVLFVAVFIFSVFLSTIFAAESPNYGNDPENSGNSSGDASSAGYQIESQVGDVATGTSVGVLYQLDHGFFYPDGNVSLTFLVAPEKRVTDPPNGDPLPNWDCSEVRVQVRAVGSTVPVFETTVGPTSTDGEWLVDIPTSLSVGVYDVAVKGISHLTLLKSSVSLSDGVNYVDLSDDGLGGIVYMLAGDVNLTFGDDKVNSLDIGTILPELNLSTYRTDLNQDDKVNSLDLGMMVANLNLMGE